MPPSQLFHNFSNNFCADKSLPVSYCLLAPNHSTTWYAWDRSGIRVIVIVLVIGYCIVHRFIPSHNQQRQQIIRSLLYICNFNRPPAVNRQELFILILIGIFMQHCLCVLQMYRVSLHTVIARPRYQAVRFRTFGDVLEVNLRIKVHRSLQLSPAQEAVEAVGYGSEFFYELDFRAIDTAYLVRCEDARRLALSAANYDSQSEQLRLTVVRQPVFTRIRTVCERDLRLFEAGLLEGIDGNSIVRVKTGPNETKLLSNRAGLKDYVKFLFSWLSHLSVAVIVFVFECCLGRSTWQWKGFRWRTNRRVLRDRSMRSKSEPCVLGREGRLCVRRFSIA